MKDNPIHYMEYDEPNYKKRMDKAYKKAKKKPVEQRSIEDDIQTCLPFVYGLARKLSIKTQIPLEDLISVGNLGLCEAAARYDKSHGTKLITFAYYRIKYRILQYVDKFVKRQHTEISESDKIWDNENDEFNFVAEEPNWETDGLLAEINETENNTETETDGSPSLPPQFLLLGLTALEYHTFRDYIDCQNYTQVAEKYGFRHRDDVKRVVINTRQKLIANMKRFDLTETDLLTIFQS